MMAEEDMRIICGDTTAEIAAGLLGAELVMEPPPEEGWGEVPPVSRMVGADGRELMSLVTEGVVTMRVARERLAAAGHPGDLRRREDGASRLARLLLTADKVRFIVGLAVNPAQVELAINFAFPKGGGSQPDKQTSLILFVFAKITIQTVRTQKR